MKPSRYLLGERLGSNLTEQVDRLFAGENLTETILHAHLLIERALTNILAEKLAQPKILAEVQWSFHQKCSLYIGLVDPPGPEIRRLRGFNQLRNAIAHAIDVDVEAAVTKYLLIEKERPDDADIVPPNALSHVRLFAGVILMGDLCAIIGWCHEPIDWNDADREFERLFERNIPESAEGEISN